MNALRINALSTLRIFAGASLLAALGAAFVVSRPGIAAAYSLIGGNLSLAQRDFRVFNNFTDSTANNNVTPHANFPGATGARMAIWKGHVEWGSWPYGGNGLGDGITSNILGDGNANFDNTWQGSATTIGTTDSNIHSELAGGGGGVLAFTETPISNGWRIRYYSSWTWQDGPGSVFSGIDLQGVACHEIGHSLGLGHSTAAGQPTMYYAISGSGTINRSIETDDRAGVQAIYGVKSAAKPRITSLTGSKSVGGTLTINGSNFTATGNEVWFTKANSDGNPLKKFSVASINGGTRINVVIPSGSVDGQVLVKNGSGSSHANLSDAWPLDIGSALVFGGFTEIPPGLAGSAGMPYLGGGGDLTPGSAEGFVIVTDSVAPSAAGVLFVSLEQGSLPLKGGTLYAVPVAAQAYIAVDGAGETQFSAAIPASVPGGTVLVLQEWFFDAGAPQGVSATNGLRIDVP